MMERQETYMLVDGSIGNRAPTDIEYYISQKWASLDPVEMYSTMPLDKFDIELLWQIWNFHRHFDCVLTARQLAHIVGFPGRVPRLEEVGDRLEKLSAATVACHTTILMGESVGMEGSILGICHMDGYPAVLPGDLTIFGDLVELKHNVHLGECTGRLRGSVVGFRSAEAADNKS